MGKLTDQFVAFFDIDINCWTQWNNGSIAQDVLRLYHVLPHIPLC